MQGMDRAHPLSPRSPRSSAYGNSPPSSRRGPGSKNGSGRKGGSLSSSYEASAPITVLLPPGQYGAAGSSPGAVFIPGQTPPSIGSSPSANANSPPNLESEISSQNLYKTELCRSFEETGTCRYGIKCQFAHGKADLRPVLRHPKYKTEICKTWQTIGTCPYGSRCRFVHAKDEEFGTGFVQIARSMEGDKKISSSPRLSVFADLEGSPSVSPLSGSLPSSPPPTQYTTATQSTGDLGKLRIS